MRYLAAAVVLFLAFWYVGGYDDKCEPKGEPGKTPDTRTIEDSQGNLAPVVSRCFPPEKINGTEFCKYRNEFLKGTDEGKSKEEKEKAAKAFSDGENMAYDIVKELDTRYKDLKRRFNGGCNYTINTLISGNDILQSRSHFDQIVFGRSQSDYDVTRMNRNQLSIDKQYNHKAMMQCPKAVAEFEEPKLEHFKLNIETILKKCTRECTFNASHTFEHLWDCTGVSPTDNVQNYTIIKSEDGSSLDFSKATQDQINRFFGSRMLAIKSKIRMVNNSNVHMLPFDNILEWDEKAGLQLHNNLNLQLIAIDWRILRKNTEMDVFGNPKLNNETIDGFKAVETIRHQERHPEIGDCQQKHIQSNTSDCSYIDGDVEFTAQNTTKEYYMNNIIRITGKVSVTNHKYSFFQFPRLEEINNQQSTDNCVSIDNNAHLAYSPFPKLKTLKCHIDSKYTFFMNESQVNYTLENEAHFKDLAKNSGNKLGEIFYQYTCRTGDSGRVPKNFCSKIEGKVVVHYDENKCQYKDTYRLVKEIWGTLTFENCPTFTRTNETLVLLEEVHSSGFFPALTIKNVAKITDADFRTFEFYHPNHHQPGYPKLYVDNSKKLVSVDTTQPIPYWEVAKMQVKYGGTEYFEVKKIGERPPGVCVFVDPAITVSENCTTIEGDLVLNRNTKSVGKNVANITGCLIMKNTNLPDYSFLNQVIVEQAFLNIPQAGPCMWKELFYQRFSRKTFIDVNPRSCIPFKVSSKPFKDDRIRVQAIKETSRNRTKCGECYGDTLGDNCRVVTTDVVLEGNDTSNQRYHQLRNVREIYGKLTIRNTNLTKIKLNRLEIFEGPAGSGEWIHVENNRYLEMVVLPEKVKQQIGNRTKYVNNPTMETRTTVLATRRTTPVKTTTTTKPHKVFDQNSKKSEKDEAKGEESGGLDNADVLLIVTGVIAVVVILLVIAAFAFAFTMRVRQMRAEAEREELLEEERASATATPATQNPSPAPQTGKSD